MSAAPLTKPTHYLMSGPANSSPDAELTIVTGLFPGSTKTGSLFLGGAQRNKETKEIENTYRVYEIGEGERKTNPDANAKLKMKVGGQDKYAFVCEMKELTGKNGVFQITADQAGVDGKKYFIFKAKPKA